MAWFRRLSPLPQSIVVVVAVAAVTAALAVGSFLGFVAWNDHQFKNGAYCQAHPSDPLC
jgi:hypothetical protein